MKNKLHICYYVMIFTIIAFMAISCVKYHGFNRYDYLKQYIGKYPCDDKDKLLEKSDIKYLNKEIRIKL